MTALQLILFCGLFILMVRLSVIGGAVNALYFYPKAYQELAYSRGIAERENVQQKRKRFMLPFVLVMFLALLLIIGVWNRADSFCAAYLQSVLFLEVMNWFDGLVIDKLWVGCSPFWRIPGMEGVPYVQSWTDMLKKRGLLTILFPVLSVIPAGIVVMLTACMA